MSNDRKYNIKRLLFRHLKKENAFWSYDQKSVSLARMGDDFLIEKVLYHLDWEDVLKLFEIYPKKQIKYVWREKLCPLGQYFGRINILYASVLFDIKHCERYIRVHRNKHIKKVTNVDNPRKKRASEIECSLKRCCLDYCPKYLSLNSGQSKIPFA